MVEHTIPLVFSNHSVSAWATKPEVDGFSRPLDFSNFCTTQSGRAHMEENYFLQGFDHAILDRRRRRKSCMFFFIFIQLRIKFFATYSINGQRSSRFTFPPSKSRLLMIIHTISCVHVVPFILLVFRF